jgi:hypothetical protein
VNVAEFRKCLPKFEKWLVTRGAEILAPTNPFEMLRFVSAHGTSIVYRNLKGQVTFTGEAKAAHQAYAQPNNKDTKPWHAGNAKPRAKTSPHIRTIRKRDGDRCFFCGLVVMDEDASTDHLVERTAGGPDHISNLVLMHKHCNSICAGMSAPEKIRAYLEWHR